MATSPTARSLSFLRRAGFIACVVERWIPHANIRSDAFAFGDLLAAHPGKRVVMLVQVTTNDHVAARLKKAKAQPELFAWLKAGGTFEVHVWTLRKRTLARSPRHRRHRGTRRHRGRGSAAAAAPVQG